MRQVYALVNLSTPNGRIRSGVNLLTAAKLGGARGRAGTAPYSGNVGRKAVSRWAETRSAWRVVRVVPWTAQRTGGRVEGTVPVSG